MSAIDSYFNSRAKRDTAFAEDFAEGYENFKIGVLLKQAREASGLTQEQLAKQMQTKKSAISRIENHAEDIRLSTLEKFASVLGRKLEIRIR